MTKLKLGISALVVAGTATALVLQHQATEKLRGANEALTQQLAQLQTESESFSNRLAAAGDSKKLSNDQFNELLKLRGEVGVLRRQLESRRSQPTEAQKERVFAVQKSSSFVSINQMTNAGLDTPEATMQTYFQGIISTNYDQVVTTMTSQIKANELNDPQSRDGFAKAYGKATLNFQGIQMLAKKTLADDKVDLEVLVFEANKPPEISIAHMVKEGSQWKYAGSASVSSSWGKEGQIQSMTP